jgi:PAS domain S-box-containing protein
MFKADLAQRKSSMATLFPTNGFSRFKRFWSNLSLRRRRTIVSSIPVVCLAFGLGSWIIARQQAIASNIKINQSQAVISNTDHLLIEFLSAQAAIRGYYATREPQFLASYQNTIAELPNLFDQLQQTSQNRPNQIERLDTLNQLVGRARLLSQQTIETLGEQSFQPFQQQQLSVLLGQDARLLQQMQTILQDLKAAEKRSLLASQQELQNIRYNTTIVMGVVAGVGLIGAIATLYLLDQLEQELRRGELQLRESQGHMQAIVDNVVDGILTLDGQGYIETFNPAAVMMFGYQPDEVIGQTLGMLIEESIVNEKGHGKTVHLIDNNQILLDRPYRTKGKRKVGSAFPIEITVTDMKLDHQLIAIIRDVTERQQAETAIRARANELVRLTETLAKTNEMLADRNRELDQFAYVASHDLKAPLRAIANLSEWIEEDLAGQVCDDVQHHISLLRNRVRRMQGLINGLLEYARAGRTKAPVETVQVDDLLQEVVDLIDLPPEFRVDIGSDMPTLKTRRVPLRQVFTNLISNAVKHHHRHDGRVTISARALDSNTYEFAISDDGPGIAPEHHEKIFNMFQMIGSRDTHESTGVGLAIVKKIIEIEGGIITLESEPEEGTTFHFTWNDTRPSELI